MPFGIGFEALARGVERDMFTDAGDDILQSAPFRHVIQHIIGGDQRYVLCAGEGAQFAQFAAIAFAMQHGGGKPHTAWCLCRQLPQQCGAFFHIRPAEPVGRHDDQQQSILPCEKIGQ